MRIVSFIRDFKSKRPHDHDQNKIVRIRTIFYQNLMLSPRGKNQDIAADLMKIVAKCSAF